MTDDDKTAEGQQKREADTRRAEQRMREEMGRHKRQEEAQLKTFKFGCIGILVALAVATILAFFF